MPAAGRTLAILLAIGLAAVATFAIWLYVESADERAREDVELVQVFRATGLIEAGTTFSAANSRGLIVSSEELAALVPDDYVDDLDEIRDLVAKTDILPNDIIRSRRFDTAADAAKNFEVPADKVALSLLVDTIEGVAGFVNVGDHISVLAYCQVTEVTLNAEGQPIEGSDLDNNFSSFLVKDIEVLALGQRVRVTTEAGTTDAVQQADDGVLSTLAVSEAEAEALVFAYNGCELHYTLLPEGFEPTPTSGRSFANLFN